MNITSKLGPQIELLLTPAHNSLIDEYFSSRGGDYYRLWVDWTLADEIQAKFEKVDPILATEFRKGLLDYRLTKMFRNIKNTDSNLEHYHTRDVPCGRHNINFRVAVYIIKMLCGIKNGELSPRRFKSLDDLKKSFSNIHASAGIIAPGSEKIDVIEQIFDVANKIRDEIRKGTSWDLLWLPAIAFHRSQISGFVTDGRFTPETIKYKDRIVWGVDAATVAVEGQYARVIIERLKRAFWQYSGGKDSKVIHDLIYSFCVGKYWCTTDISKFDQNLQSWVIDEVFDLIKSWFPKECGREIGWIANNFKNTKIIDYEGQLVSTSRGVPSGSYFTQIVGSLGNLLQFLTYLASIDVGGTFDSKVNFVLDELAPVNNYSVREYATVFAMGDDLLAFTRHPFSLKAYATYVKKFFGMTVNPEKSSGGLINPPEYLKRIWKKDGEWREPLEFFLQISHPEFPREYIGYSKWHILFSLYHCYTSLMRQFWSEEELIQGMMKSKLGFEPLLTLGKMSGHSLPGVLRTLSDVQRLRLYERAKALSAAS